MPKNLNLADFTGPPCAWDGFRDPHYEKILALSDEEFKLLYLLRMEEYRDKDGWWKEEPAPKPIWKASSIPECSKCHKVIAGPAELRRYAGRSLHGPCFRKVYGKERNDEPDEWKRRYWDRVAELPDVLER
ncbi:Uncharacterised protein [uncultured archaeon]|nr:Uncharacterised protein [uncultured archaeon]